MPDPKTDAFLADSAIIQDAYSDALKDQFKQLINNDISDDKHAEAIFSNGLALIRKAREQALTLVQK